jgi:hypothetical protein
MKYELKVVDKSGNLLDILKGEDVDELLKKAAKLITKDFLGYYYEKERMMQNACSAFAQSLTDEIKKHLLHEQTIFPRKDYALPEITWELLLNDFYEQNPQPQKDTAPVEPVIEKIPPQPNMNDAYYQYKFNIKDEILPFRKKQTIDKLRLEFQKDYLVWEKKKDSIEARNNEKLKEYKEKLKIFEDDYANKLGDWIDKKASITDRTRTFKEGYQNLKSFAVEKFCELILTNSTIENFAFKRKVSLKYIEATKFLFVEYQLPTKSELSSIKEIAYSAESGKYEEIRFTESELDSRYKLVLYELMFKSLFELFYLDKKDALNEITFRGIIIDERTGLESKHLIPVLSFKISKNDFLKINFDEHLNLSELFHAKGGVYQLSQSSSALSMGSFDNYLKNKTLSENP